MNTTLQLNYVLQSQISNTGRIFLDFSLHHNISLLGVKRPGREAEQSPPSSVEVKNTWSYISIPPHVFMV